MISLAFNTAPTRCGRDRKAKFSWHLCKCCMSRHEEIIYIAEDRICICDPFALARIFRVTKDGEMSRYAKGFNGPITDILWQREKGTSPDFRQGRSACSSIDSGFRDAVRMKAFLFIIKHPEQRTTSLTPPLCRPSVFSQNVRFRKSPSQ